MEYLEIIGKKDGKRYGGKIKLTNSVNILILIKKFIEKLIDKGVEEVEINIIYLPKEF